MIKSRTANTYEIDDTRSAVDEIVAQLNLDANPLLKNSVGIVSCFSEFIDSGVIEELGNALPFEIIGGTTIACGVPQGEGETMLSLLVLTSDDVEFATASSAPVMEEDEAPLAEMYASAAAKLAQKPVLMISYAPLLTSVGGDYYAACMSGLSDNLPNFGTYTVDHNTDYHDSKVILNGESWPDRFAILLMAGNVQPSFYIGTISDTKIFPERGAVTASKGNQLQTIDGMAAVEYLQSLGLGKNEDGSITGINSFPVIVDYNDGTMPVIRAMFATTPEGHVVCGGNTPVGSTLSIGSFDPEEIRKTSAATIEKAIADHPDGTFLVFSCIGRYFAQGYEAQAEMKTSNDLLRAAGRPYIGSYSGGELCPVFTADGAMINRNHNNTLVVCAL